MKRIKTFIYILGVVCFLGGVLISNNTLNVFASSYDSSVNYDKRGFKTNCGIVLNQKEYNVLAEVFSDEMIAAMPKATLQRYRKMDKIIVYDEQTEYVKVDEVLDPLTQKLRSYSETIVSEQEAKRVLNLPSTCSSNYSTAMKKITIQMVSGALPEYQTVTLKCEWLKLPKTRSFDVIGIRPGNNCQFYSTSSDPNFYGVQVTNDKTYNYGYGNGNVKISSSSTISGVRTMNSSSGIGISMNLANKASKIRCEMAVTLRMKTKSLKVYGSYQHAQQNVSLADSHKYSFKDSGYGKVFKFNSSVQSKYDNTTGVDTNYAP